MLRTLVTTKAGVRPHLAQRVASSASSTMQWGRAPQLCSPRPAPQPAWRSRVGSSSDWNVHHQSDPPSETKSNRRQVTSHSQTHCLKAIFPRRTPSCHRTGRIVTDSPPAPLTPRPRPTSDFSSQGHRWLLISRAVWALSSSTSAASAPSPRSSGELMPWEQLSTMAGERH